MSQDGLEDTTGITLFSKQTKKRRRKEKEIGDAAQKPPPGTENDSKSLEQNTAALGAETAANDEAAERQAPASSSGQEAPVTFRSLGISEWLDRCRTLCCTDLAAEQGRQPTQL